MFFFRVGNSPFLVMLLVFASAISFYYIGKIMFNFVQLQEIDKFYRLGLHIKKVNKYFRDILCLLLISDISKYFSDIQWLNAR